MSLKRCYIVMAAKQPLGFQKLSKSSDKLLILCKCGFLKTFAIFIQIVREIMRGFRKAHHNMLCKHAQRGYDEKGFLNFTCLQREIS